MADAYKNFTVDTDVVQDRTIVSSGIFSSGAGSLTAFYTASTQGASSASFLNVYDKVQTDSTREVQFACGYASYGGSGSIGNTTKTVAGNRETAGMYRQFANVLLPPYTDKFTFNSFSSASEDIFFIVMNRARMREKMDPGNWELALTATKKMRLIDDSGATTTPTVNEAGRVFNIVSGSIASGTADTFRTAAAGGALGNFYPDLGIIILDAAHLQTTASVTTTRSTNTFDDTPSQLFKQIAAGAYFAARREEEVTSTMYFCRATNKEFNFSNNPTFATKSGNTEGVFTQTTFEGAPKTYMTQVGLYNSKSELLAVAKLSKPVLKSFSREAVIKVKLDF